MLSSPRNRSIAAGAALIFLRVLHVSARGTIDSLPSVCLWHRWTGWPCPLCGMTRSLVSCAHGQWRAAWLFHPLGPILFAVLLGVLVAPLVPSRLRLNIRSSTIVTRCEPQLLRIATVSVLALWLVRLGGALPWPP